MDEATYEVSVTCYRPNPDVVLVTGGGFDPESEEVVKVYIDVDDDSPYVGIYLNNGETVIEASLSEPLDVFMQDGVIRAAAIRFVRDLDLETGLSTPAGFGEVEIICRGFEETLPTQ